MSDKTFGWCSHCDSEDALELKEVLGKSHLDRLDTERYLLPEHTNARAKRCDGSGTHPMSIQTPHDL
jgi:hypothetical protein